MISLVLALKKMRYYQIKKHLLLAYVFKYLFDKQKIPCYFNSRGFYNI